ncbi:MAG: DUF4430 domain-containing protein [Lachnospiraceae bacterium]|nr:DUF4430 domain-containing protein [Lachnospiraceae bacterium]
MLTAALAFTGCTGSNSEKETTAATKESAENTTAATKETEAPATTAAEETTAAPETTVEATTAAPETTVEETTVEETTVEETTVEETTVEDETTADEETADETGSEDEGIKIGEGETHFDFSVTFSDGSEKHYCVYTDEENVGAALLDVELIAGEDSQYGLYVKTVDGETADYDKDSHYWAFYIDGEYAMTGVDATPVEDGKTYAFKYE